MREHAWLFQTCLFLFCGSCFLLAGLLIARLALLAHRSRLRHCLAAEKPLCMQLPWRTFRREMGWFNYEWAVMGECEEEIEQEWWEGWDRSLVETMVVMATTQRVAAPEQWYLADTLSTVVI